MCIRVILILTLILILILILFLVIGLFRQWRDRQFAAVRAYRKSEQKDLAREIDLQGMEITPLIISRIENNPRHVCDTELLMLAKVLKISMEWLCGKGEDLPK